MCARWGTNFWLPPPVDTSCWPSTLIAEYYLSTRQGLSSVLRAALVSVAGVGVVEDLHGCDADDEDQGDEQDVLDERSAALVVADSGLQIELDDLVLLHVAVLPGRAWCAPWVPMMLDIS